MNKNIDKKKYKKALDFAYKIHFKQSRKGTGIPYFTHLVSVSNNIIEDGGTTDEAIGGLLHDAVEDQGGLKTLINTTDEGGAVTASDKFVVTVNPTKPRHYEGFHAENTTELHESEMVTRRVFVENKGNILNNNNKTHVKIIIKLKKNILNLFIKTVELFLCQ